MPEEVQEAVALVEQVVVPGVEVLVVLEVEALEGPVVVKAVEEEVVLEVISTVHITVKA